MDLEAFVVGLGEGKTAKEIADAINKDFLPKNFVPSEKYKNVKSELGTTKEQLEKLNGSVQELTGKAGSADELKASFEAIQKEYTEYKNGEETRLTGLKKQSVLEKALLKNKLDEHSVEDAMRYFDLEKIVVKEDGSLDGFDSQLESFRSKKPNWFAQTVVSDPHGKPADGGTVTKTETRVEALERLTKGS
jgi:hypothetical protein